MTEKEFRERYGTLKFQEMFERDEEKRKEISKQIKTLETTYKRSSIDAMLSENSISNDETVEIEGGKVK